MKKSLLSLLCLGACSSDVHQYAAETPSMDFISYFAGETHGYGAIYDFKGDVSDRFHVRIEGTVGKNSGGQRTLTIAEDFTYASGKTQKRNWAVTETAPGKLTGLAPDVPGKAEGLTSGNAIKFTYKIDVPRESGSTVRLASEDWMWMLADGVLLNRNYLSKFGIPVAELVINFHKNP